jgi:hypothetical protein
MIKEQNNVVFNSMQDGHVVVYGAIDVGFILNITCYNLLPHPSSLLKKVGGVEM